MSKKQELMTRGEVARLLDCSISTIRRLEKSGGLFPKIDKNGVRRFDRAEVDELARRRSIPSSAESLRGIQIRTELKALELFDAGKDAAEVMRTMRSMTYAEVTAAWEFSVRARTMKLDPKEPARRNRDHETDASRSDLSRLGR